MYDNRFLPRVSSEYLPARDTSCVDTDYCCRREIRERSVNERSAVVHPKHILLPRVKTVNEYAVPVAADDNSYASCSPRNYDIARRANGGFSDFVRSHDEHARTNDTFAHSRNFRTFAVHSTYVQYSRTSRAPPLFAANVTLPASAIFYVNFDSACILLKVYTLERDNVPTWISAAVAQYTFRRLAAR